MQSVGVAAIFYAVVVAVVVNALNLVADDIVFAAIVPTVLTDVGVVVFHSNDYG